MHHLFVTLLTEAPERYKEFLNDAELVNGGVTEWSFRLENIGVEPFGGGRISFLSFNHYLQGGGTLQKGLEDHELEGDNGLITTIQPNEYALVGRFSHHVLLAGLLEVELGATAADGQQVDLYQGRDLRDEHSARLSAFYNVIERVQLDALIRRP